MDNSVRLREIPLEDRNDDTGFNTLEPFSETITGKYATARDNPFFKKTQKSIISTNEPIVLRMPPNPGVKSGVFIIDDKIIEPKEVIYFDSNKLKIGERGLYHIVVTVNLLKYIGNIVEIDLVYYDRPLPLICMNSESGKGATVIDIGTDCCFGIRNKSKNIIHIKNVKLELNYLNV